MFHIIRLFEEASSLNINHQKSEILGINLEDHELPMLASKFSCKISSWPTTYLGLPLHCKHRSISFWDPMLEKIKKRLQTWKNSFLTKGVDLLSYKPHYPISLHTTSPFFICQKKWHTQLIASFPGFFGKVTVRTKGCILSREELLNNQL